MKTKKKMLFLQLNEINFDYINDYIKNGLDLPAFKNILKWNNATLKSENSYNLLEPWIQWASIHSGLEYKEHKIFRLGDAVTQKQTTIFEEIEANGYSVGAISPMNVANRMTKPTFFIPDPWTNTKTDNSWISKFTHIAIRQLVNDNASGKIKFSTLFRILSVSAVIFNFGDICRLLSYILKAKFKKKWFKVIAFDFFLAKLFINYRDKFNPDFSVLFLNGCAHIQHHYLLSSPFANKNMQIKNPSWYIKKNKDPFKDMLVEYDKIIGEIILNSKTIICTGLTQTSVNTTVFYYRLKNHVSFLKKIGVFFINIQPRMSRDFLVEFNNNFERDKAYEILNNIYVNKNNKLFGIIDKRENELFVTLDYPMEISKSTAITDIDLNIIPLNLKEYVTLVAIKNGKHSDKCFLFCDENFSNPQFLNGKHCKNIFKYILNEFPKIRKTQVTFN